VEAAAGEVLEQQSLGLSTQLEDYRRSSLYEALATIHGALQRHRGFVSFVGAGRLRGADYFLPRHRLTVEFDESQHFTAPRRLALSLYPVDVPLGFDLGRWMTLCAQLDRHDRRPPYRDEQRAWLDALRDFSAPLLGNRPTVRVYAGDEAWCSLDRGRQQVEAFKRRYLPEIA
jgi:hypothetical protein